MNAGLFSAVKSRRSIRAGSPAFLTEVAAAVHSVDASVPVANVRTRNDAYRQCMAQTSFTVTLIDIAAVMALALATSASTEYLRTRWPAGGMKWASAWHSAPLHFPADWCVVQLSYGFTCRENRERCLRRHLQQIQRGVLRFP